MRLAVIPARGGSKRIPRKNIRLFHGIPMIARSIQAALEAKAFDRVIVSTDDDEIAEIAVRHGAEVPFKRPAALADDFTGTGAVVEHAVSWYQAQGADVEFVCCIYATAPFLEAGVLRDAYAKLIQSPSKHNAFSVCKFDPNPLRAFTITQGEIQMLYPENMPKRSQDLPDVYHDAGQFYWQRVEHMNRSVMFSGDSIPIELSADKVQDIDTEDDWLRAERLFSWLNR